MKRSRHSSNRSSSGTIDDENILAVIFLYLPIISLMRFKSVCKLWLATISGPFFAQKHTMASIERDPNFLTPSGFFIFNTFDTQTSSVSLPKTRGRIQPSLPSLSFLGQNFNILQSCNGLLICQLSCGTSCVCNPTTGKFKILPSASLGGEFSWISPFTLALDPSKSPNYKVVCLKKLKKEVPESTGSYYFQIFMYSSETGCWNASTRFELNMCSDMAAGIFSNGAIHWQCHELYIRFDLNEKNVRLMRMPFIYGGHEYSWEIGCLWQWRDKVYSCIQNDQTWNLHELGQSNFEWTVQKYNIAAYHISRLAFNAIKKQGQSEQNRYDEKERKWSVLAIVRGDNEKDTIVLVAILGKVISFNFARRKVKLILDLGLPGDVAGDVCRNYLNAYQYIQSLSPV